MVIADYLIKTATGVTAGGFYFLMISIKDQWGTTPTVCRICNHKMQLVFPVVIITIDDQESWKLPTDVECPQCHSTDIEFIDFKNDSK